MGRLLIRAIAPDELEWFIASTYGFLGHSDPRAFARRAIGLIRDRAHEAERSFVLLDGDEPLAGAYIVAPEPEDDEQNLYLSNIWFSRAPGHLTALLSELMDKHPHEAVRCPLYNFSPNRVERVRPVFEGLGFSLEHAHDLEFPLSETPPLGLPLMLEAYTEEMDVLFARTFARCESYQPTDSLWAWLKRWRGKFSPDLWWLARETPDQEPVGYAFFGAYQTGVEGSYYLTAAGVLAEHRGDSEMLRRLVISSMQELAAMSPFGKIETTVTYNDPKLVKILEGVGFTPQSHYPVFVKEPV
jgi:hypothetical protein